MGQRSAAHERRRRRFYITSASRYCNEYGAIYAISSDFGDRMTTQHLN